MARELIKPRHDRLFRDRISGLVSGLSKKSSAFAVQDTKARCSNCEYDEARKSSSGKYNGVGPRPFTGKVCPVCLGAGTVTSTKKTKLVATVNWGESTVSDGSLPLPEGELPKGHAEIKVLIAQVPVCEGASYFIVDGVRCAMVGHITTSGLLTKATGTFVVKIEK
jgi:hypothetical protein